jgi:hypothetical protein
MASKYKIPPRAGFDYQDIVALNLVVEMMTHPDRYQWIQVERDDAGYLDDVTALRSDGEYVYWQVKFSVDPETKGDSYTWKSLLDREEGKTGPKDSLLMKWSKSLNHVMQQGPLAEAALISNRKASADLNTVFKNFDQVDFDKIRDAGTKKEIRKQLGSLKKARSFFDKFHFRLDQPGLNVREEAVKRKFTALGGTNEGWLSLKDSMRTWGRERNQPPPDGLITLEKAKKAAKWLVLRRMPQEFEVPPDYVVPSQGFLDGFVDEILSDNQKVSVLTATPGTGKSTFLSYLVKKWRDQNIPVLRHHYFLSLTDRTPDRLLHRRVAESLMKELTELYPDSLGATVSTNPNPEHLGQWLEQCGHHFRALNQSLIVIIDGLDHVPRHKGGRFDEVSDLFNHLLPAPEGVKIVIGSQPLEEPNVPSRLLENAPRESWKHLPCLDLSGVRVWLTKNADATGTDENQYPKRADEADQIVSSPQKAYQLQLEKERRENEIDAVARAFWSVSSGHPVHLRYCLNYLRENSLPITTTTVSKLPACSGGNIEQYYRNLFDSVLHEQGRQILHLLTVCRFEWPERGILDCLDLDGRNRAVFVEALKSMKHLTKETELGISPFHSSLIYYIGGRQDHEHYRDICRESALVWLGSLKAPEYLKWNHEWILTAEFGNPEPLIEGPDRSWAIDSLVKRYAANETLRIMSMSCRAALERGRVAKYLQAALLRDYVDSTFEGHETALEIMLEAQLVHFRKDPYLLARLKRNLFYLSTAELLTVARYAQNQKNQRLVVDVFDHLNDRMDRPSFSVFENDFRPELVRLAALRKDISPSKVADYVFKQEEENVSPYLIDLYADELRRSGRVGALETLLDIDLPVDQCKTVAREMALLGMEHGIKPNEKFLNKDLMDPFSAVWTQLTGTAAKNLNYDFPFLTCREEERYQGLGAHDARKKAIIKEFREAFFCLLSNHLAGRPGQNEEWLNYLGNSSYEGRFLRKINEISAEMALSLKNRAPVGLGFVFDRLRDFENPESAKDSQSWDLYLSVLRAAVQIGLDAILIGQSGGVRLNISRYEIELVFNSKFCNWSAWTEIYLPLGRPWMSKESVIWLLDWMKSMDSFMDTFADRALIFAQMSVLSSSHGLADRVPEYLRAAAANLLGYGHHKDILLSETLDVISDSQNAGIAESRNWILRLAPAVANVSEFTDGDGTRYLPERMAEALARMDTGLLLSYYQWLLSKEEYYTADKALEAYITTADLSSPFDKAVASTTLNTKGIEILENKAAAGDQSAPEVLSSIESYLGSLPLQRKENHSGNVKPSNRIIEDTGPNPLNYPPDKIMDYISELMRGKPGYHPRGVRIEAWARFWSANHQPTEAFEALNVALNHGVEFHVSDDLTEIALRYLGNDSAFEWLVQAHGRNKGWMRWGYRDDAVRRWEKVKQRYTDRWFEFLTRSIALENEIEGPPFGKQKVRRMIEYCIFMEQFETAKELGEAVIQFVNEAVSPIVLPVPEWVPKNA